MLPETTVLTALAQETQVVGGRLGLRWVGEVVVGRWALSLGPGTARPVVRRTPFPRPDPRVTRRHPLSTWVHCERPVKVKGLPEEGLGVDDRHVGN